MSKKIASGADAIVLDVKTGSGAFMKKLEQSIELAETMVAIGNKLGRQTLAVISDMNQPLGLAVGNALEVKEAIDVLHGKGPEDVRELCLTLGSHMVQLAGKASSAEEAREQLKEAIRSGKALKTLKTFIEAQGGDPAVADDPNKLPTAKHISEVIAEQPGFVSEIVADKIGTAAMLLGAGRATKDADIDLAVGIVLAKKIGERVEEGEVLARLHSNRTDVAEVMNVVKQAYSITNKPVKAPALLYEVIR